MPRISEAIHKRNKQSLWRTTLFLGGGTLLLAVSGCYRAPEVTGGNQVYNPNIEATAIKDNEFQNMSWPAVDTSMSNLVPDSDNQPGCAVGVVRDHQIIYLKGYGYARLPGGGDSGEKWGAATMGAVGSVSKTFTAVAAMQMGDQGLIDVNGQTEDYLGTSNNALGNVRIYDLLSHSSGVGGPIKDDAFQPDFTPGSDVQNCINDDPSTSTPWCQEVVQALARPAYQFSQFEENEPVSELGMTPEGLKAGVYSNVGYSVLGAIIDRVARAKTGSDGYEAYVWDNVGIWSSNPLQGGHMLSLALTHSWRDTDIPHRAIGYLGNEFSVLEAWDNTGEIEGWEGPAGGWAMTIGDLSRFMIALDQNQFFAGSASLPAMRHEWSDLDELPDLYGFGMFLGPGDSTGPDYWHGGTIGPHNSVWTWYENIFGSEVGVAIMCNRGDANLWDQKGVANTIAIIASTGDPTPAGSIQFNPIDPAATKGQVFALDATQSWQSAPRGAFVPITGLANTLLLTPTASRYGISSLKLDEGQLTEKGIKFSGRVGSTLKTRYFSNPYFKVAGPSVLLASELGDVALSDVVITGAFAGGGKSMAEVSLSGTIDARQFASSGGYSASQICGYVRDAGAACRPCADGQMTCIDMRYEGLKASLVGAGSTRR